METKQMTVKKAMNDYADILQKKYNIPKERALIMYKHFATYNEAMKLNALMAEAYN